VARLLTDLALDARDNIYLAAWEDGIIKLNPTADKVRWSHKPLKVTRLDAGPQGYCAALGIEEGDKPFDKGHNVLLYDPQGKQLAAFGAGKWKFDICIHEPSQTVIYVGFKNAHTGRNPVQICYIRGAAYDGSEKYTCYDWSADPDSDRYLNKPANNMADTRAYRCAVGRDGKLYCAFESAGGNHIFRYSPFDITQKVEIVGGDKFHEWYNTRAEHKTFFARYDPATGAYLAGQQFCGRLSSGRGNAVRVKEGDLTADETGRVYLVGAAASGLPMPPSHPDQKTGRCLVGAYAGGAFLLVMSPDFKDRLFCARFADQTTHAVSARSIADTTHIALTGRGAAEVYTHHPIQPALNGPQDGWFSALHTPANK
jgi:hypothetical protein